MRPLTKSAGIPRRLVSRRKFGQISVSSKVENGISKRHALAGQRLPRDSGRRDDERAIWIGFLQSPRESDAGKHFAYGNGMNPDSPGALGGQLGERRK